jgi:hypothetical protein
MTAFDTFGNPKVMCRDETPPDFGHIIAKDQIARVQFQFIPRIRSGQGSESAERETLAVPGNVDLGLEGS